MKRIAVVMFVSLALLLGAKTQAGTIIQDFEDTTGWTNYIGATSGATIYTEMPTGGYGQTLVTRFVQPNNATSDGVAYFGVPLGTSAISAGTGAGNVQEFWIQSDILFRGGSSYSGYFISLVGLFNSAGDNDNNPVANWAGLAPTPNDYLSISVKDSAAQTGAPYVQMAAGVVGLTARITGHVYSSGGQTLMDAAISQIDTETGAITYVTGINGYVLLAAGETFDQGLDFFGVRNIANGGKARDSRITWDNIYFSTEGAYSGDALPSWIQPIPEPATLAILALGSLFALRSKKK